MNHELDIIIQTTFKLPPELLKTDEVRMYAKHSDKKIIVITDSQEYARYYLLQGKILNTRLLGIFDIIDDSSSALRTVIQDNITDMFMDTTTTKHVLFVMEIDKSETIKDGTKAHVLIMRNIVNVYNNLVAGLKTHKKFATIKSILTAIDNIGKNDELYNKQLMANLNIISDAFLPNHHLQLAELKHWRTTKSGHILNVVPVTNIKVRTFDKFSTLVRIVGNQTLEKNKAEYEKLFK